MRFLASEIAVATGGDLVGPDREVTGATHDSRQVRGGELFVAVIAERDGHDFVAAAVQAGASAYLTSRGPVPGLDAAAIVVDDTVAALGRLAATARLGMSASVVGITGSVGKTTVKDLSRAVLVHAGGAHAASQSFNNEIGVPLTLLGAPAGVAHLVVEMGARGLGHIEALSRIVRPTVGLVTRVALAHSEAFGSIEEIARGKGELVEALEPSGTAVLNAGDERVLSMRHRTVARVLTFGVECGEVRASEVEVADDLRIRFRLETPWGRVLVEPAVRGPHNAENAVAAAAVGLLAGLGPDDVAEGLGAADLSPLRMELHTTPRGAVVLDDSYNASPASMRAALAALAHLPAGRRIAVLGPMAELGEVSRVEHEAVAELAGELGFELVAVGEPQYRARERGGAEVEDPAEALELLGAPGAGTAILVKASRVAGLDRLVEALLGGRPR